MSAAGRNHGSDGDLTKARDRRMARRSGGPLVTRERRGRAGFFAGVVSLWSIAAAE